MDGMILVLLPVRHRTQLQLHWCLCNESGQLVNMDVDITESKSFSELGKYSGSLSFCLRRVLSSLAIVRGDLL